MLGASRFLATWQDANISNNNPKCANFARKILGDVRIDWRRITLL
jgi:hypothetical protein